MYTTWVIYGITRNNLQVLNTSGLKRSQELYGLNEGGLRNEG